MDQLKHFSHNHGLVFHQLHPEPSHINCSGCKTPASGNVYACWQCSYFLHEQCFRASRSFKHPSHPLHPLTLVPSPTYPSGSFFCNSCKLGGDGFSYSCSACEFDIHVHCALNIPHLPHSLLPEQNYNPLPQTPIYPPPLQTNHFSSYPPQNPTFPNDPQNYPPPNPTFPNDPQNYPPPNPTFHNDPQNYPPHNSTFPNNPQNYPPPNPTFPNTPQNYHPPTSTFPNDPQNYPPQSHPQPATYSPVPNGPYPNVNPTHTHSQHNPPPINVATPPPPQPPAPQSNPTYSTVVNPTTTTPPPPPQQPSLSPATPSMIKHFSHPHVLKPMEIEEKNAKVCSACECELSGAAYCCTEPHCTFNLHKSCFNSPPKLQHKSHLEHPLTLLSAPPYSEGFTCNACLKDGKAFCYTCETCSYDLHIDCVRWPETVTRPDHKHSLTLYYSSPAAEASQEVVFMCDVCKNPVHEMAWMYYCRDCDFGTHLECVTGGVKEQNVGAGKTQEELMREVELNFAVLQLLAQSRKNAVDAI